MMKRARTRPIVSFGMAGTLPVRMAAAIQNRWFWRAVLVRLLCARSLLRGWQLSLSTWAAWRLAPGPPGLADRAGARLADVEPSGGVHPDNVEFEDRIVRHRLDHAAHAAAGDHRERRRPQARVVPASRARALIDSSSSCGPAGRDRAPGLT